MLKHKKIPKISVLYRLSKVLKAIPIFVKEPAINGINRIIKIFTCRKIKTRPKKTDSSKKSDVFWCIKNNFTKYKNAVIANNE